KIKEGLAAGYFFSSDTITSAKTFPFLTSDISPFNSAVNYDQGELASFGAGGIREFFPQTPSPGWTDIKGSTFANPNDALLLPQTFTYAMDAQRLPDVVLEIKNPAGNTIKTVSVTNNNYRKVPIDVSNIPDLSDSKQLVFSAALHSIEISSTTGFFQQRQVLFSDKLFSPDDVGIVHITTNPSNNAFNLLATDGFLFKRRNPLGGWSNAPVFEIPFKGRSAFWKYRNDKGKNIQFNPDLNGYLAAENGFLISSRPLAVSKYHSVLHKDGSTDTKYLPNPVEYNLKKDSTSRFCFDILVPDSKLFPI
ncbi:MAG: hypothetical protein JNK79_06700, partial [Chitinophagaceae bacterium]|nr:hypothetical protein [Chitinophagaceae bacterium]